jgi:phytoene/squalene synthetase
MTVAACAAIVARGDPDRFAAAMAVSVAARAVLFPLYAFNLELARAPWMTAEPLIAEMRLQWWRDAVEEAGQGAPVRQHEVMTPLGDLIRQRALPIALFDQMAEARRCDIEVAPFADMAALESYIDHTAGNLMWLACLSLGAEAPAENAVRGLAVAAGSASYLQAVPDLVARGRVPLPLGVTAKDIAARGLTALQSARAMRSTVPKGCHAALLAGWQAGPLLHRALQNPVQTPLQSEFKRRGGLLWQAFTGRW